MSLLLVREQEIIFLNNFTFNMLYHLDRLKHGYLIQSTVYAYLIQSTVYANMCKDIIKHYVLSIIIIINQKIITSECT